VRWADIQAAEAFVQAVPILSSAVFGVSVPKPAATATQPLPYAVLYPFGGTPEASRETGPAVTEHPSFTVHLVGGSVEQVSALSELLYAVLMPDVHPTVAGRKTSRVWVA
jgi:hypothetical protein